MKTRLRYDFDLRNDRLTQADDGTLTISGLASNFDLDRQGDRMARQAFDRSLHRYLTTNPILLYSHRYSMPMGKVTAAFVDDDGLHVTAEIPRPPKGSGEAERIYELVRRGVIRAFSVGGFPERRNVGGVATITDWDIREVSIAPVGVNGGAVFSLTSQVGKAFADAAPLDRAADALDAIGLRLAVHGIRLERDRTATAARRAAMTN